MVEKTKLRDVIKKYIENYDLEHPVRTADVHHLDCQCDRCFRDALSHLFLGKLND